MENNLVRTLATAAALAVACNSHAPRTAVVNEVSAAPAQTRRDDDMVSTLLELTPDGQGWTLAFLVRNTTSRELRSQVLEPFVNFELEVTSDRGDHLSIAQPAFHVPGRPRPILLAPGGEVRLDAPFHLRFDPTVPPSGGSDPMVWSIRSPKVPALARATFEIPGLGTQIAEARLDAGPDE